MWPNTETQVCAACFEEKPIEDFYKNRENKYAESKHRHVCKRCSNKQRTENKRIQRNREQLYDYLRKRFG